jgi:hypothetical protein
MSVRWREGDAMTMYLPNSDIRPTGYEPAEFIEPPTIPPAQLVEVDDDEGDDVELRVP